jgi:protein-S-isoprenylcysteine O-methyltransferase Ste14
MTIPKVTTEETAEASRPLEVARNLARVIFILAMLDGILFGGAGRLNWIQAWVLTGIFLALSVAVLVWATRNATELMKERRKPGPNVKRWDKIIMRIYTALLLTLLVTAALDGGRFGWSHVPRFVQVIGAVGGILTGGVIWWCMAANAFLSSAVRIQTDRGHQVAQSGPYQYVRHPMYVALMILLNCVALELGSWWALVPSALIMVLFVVRTALEDQTLQEELPGYREYAARVRYRLVPGVW